MGQRVALFLRAAGEVRSVSERAEGELFSDVLPEDLLKFGLIPEFVGRLPVLGVVENLDRETLDWGLEQQSPAGFFCLFHAVHPATRQRRGLAGVRRAASSASTNTPSPPPLPRPALPCPSPIPGTWATASMPAVTR